MERWEGDGEGRERTKREVEEGRDGEREGKRKGGRVKGKEGGEGERQQGGRQCGREEEFPESESCCVRRCC